MSPALFNPKSGYVGSHFSPSVLRGEDKLTKFTSKVYDKGTELRDIRDFSGEKSYMANTSKARQRKDWKQAKRFSKYITAMALLKDRIKQLQDKLQHVKNTDEKRKYLSLIIKYKTKLQSLIDYTNSKELAGVKTVVNIGKGAGYIDFEI